MAEKFGLEFRIVDTELRQAICGASAASMPTRGRRFPRLIASMDWAKQGEGIRLLRDVLPPQPTFPRSFDLLVVDEAHNVAPTVGQYAVESQRTRFVRSLARTSSTSSS